MVNRHNSMSLIARAAELLHHDLRKSYGSGKIIDFGSSKLPDSNGFFPFSSDACFEIDFASLESAGFISPNIVRSRLAEEIRLVKHRLQQCIGVGRENAAFCDRGLHEPAGFVLVTSARPGEGKSFFALNLALSAVLDGGLDVLLVDANTLSPRLSGLLGVSNIQGPGLVDLLVGAEGVKTCDIVRFANGYPLSFIASGSRVPSVANLFDCAEMERFARTLAAFGANRLAIVDSPSLLSGMDAVALSRYARHIVMLVDAEETSYTAVESALDVLDTTRNVSFVLNKVVHCGKDEQFGSCHSDGV